jgi:adenine-specific DNA methylase
MSDDHQQTTLSSPTGEVKDLEDIDWTFKGADTQKYTHGLHSYPARMVPQIPSRLLSFYKKEGVVESGDVVYDPFSGSGTTAVEGRLHGLNAVGNDINPFAVMLTKAKAIPIERKRLGLARDALLEDLADDLRRVRENFKNKGKVDSLDMPDVLDGWFPHPQLHELTLLRDRIDQIEEDFNASIARFFRIVLSYTTRKVSYQRNGEFKRYRLSEEDRESHNPDVEGIFTNKLEKNVEMMKEYSDRVRHDLDTTVHYSDSRYAAELIGENVADIVITSPPYGDHSTTVAYGEFSRDPALLTGKVDSSEMIEVDKNGLGGRNEILEPISDLEDWSPALSATLETLREKDGRSEDALNFFSDYYAVMKQAAKITKTGQPVIWVVANRTMSRVNIPTHLITRELCEHLGYEFDVNLPREIPNKTLPWENSPENVEGVKGDMMANENLVVVKAP